MKFFTEFAARLKYGYPIGQGYRISLVNRDMFKVWHDGYEVKIVAEMMLGKINRHLYTNFSTHWLPPNDQIMIDEHERETIIELVKNHFESMGKRVKVVSKD